MLTQLNIRNYAIVEELDLELENGMTVVSGETGAGKSIMLDALGLTLGDRADMGSVRKGAERAEIIASFDISNIPTAQKWLRHQDLDDDECILRRVITTEGRSRSYINGSPCPINKVRELGEYLIEIHGQHEHQRLLKKDHHRYLLDAYSGKGELAGKTRQLFRNWQSLNNRLRQLSAQSEEQTARLQLLSYQAEELEQLGISEGEYEKLVEEQSTLANAGEILQSGQQILQLTSEAEEVNCLSLLNQCQHLLGKIKGTSPSVSQTIEMLNSAQIQIEEACQEMSHYMDRVELNPKRQADVEERLSSIFDMARKHRIPAEQLPQFYLGIQQELEGLNMSDQALEQLHQETENARQAFIDSAESLSKARKKAALSLRNEVNKQLHSLGMTAAELSVSITPYNKDQLNAHGLEEVEFLITTNAGQPPRPLNKVASGGELSRISLAIQVITAQTSSTPTLIFDEVDVGIGGAIAEVVGRLLRQLGENNQILVVTHQPQVASQGHQHLFVSKQTVKDKTLTRIDRLNMNQRVGEVARMLGGIDVTETSLDHAREMLGLDAIKS
ncbi:DNA repair protein RecN [Amphritea pacifica]|uniref:DNA repair protein RecN n=1 Tax=Amphritea pacifica TaxID=2811233 RepID=A0ABS2W3Q5_9GAMM|nr:DNA repair protein RecN [Amphritea pacifica]MBN0986335.1 DNA repair protein RecN [Amphritea pacifica]MBN1007028.1 DNA repair protein RecN [Amphritea pacifica]